MSGILKHGVSCENDRFRDAESLIDEWHALHPTNGSGFDAQPTYGENSPFEGSKGSDNENSEEG